MRQEFRIVAFASIFKAIEIDYLVKLPQALLMAMNGMNLELHEQIFHEDLFLTKVKTDYVEHKNLQLVPLILDLKILGKLYDTVTEDTLPNVSLQILVPISP